MTLKHQYRLSCEQGHVQNVTADELQALISAVAYDCPQCGMFVSIEDGVGLLCAYCGEGSRASRIDEAYEIMSAGCPDCKRSLFVSRSNKIIQKVWNNLRSPKNSEALNRKKRIDYWEGLVHFCSAAEFTSIFENRRIRAGSTGYFRLPAVCLTETPISGWAEIMSIHGSFGYVFDKREVLAHGGGPAFYITNELIQSQYAFGGFSNEIKPFVNLVRRDDTKKFYDFRHEREWRLPHDLVFKQLRPFAVIIGQLDETMDWHTIAEAVVEYDELEITQ